MKFLNGFILSGALLAIPALAIVGGTLAPIGRFRFMAGIVSIASKEDVHCGAVVLNARQVLTLARCIHNRPINDIAVLGNDYDVRSGTDTASELQLVSNKRIHPSYSPGLTPYDIAILDLSSAFSAAVQPANLPANDELPTVGQPATLLGWGTTEFAGPPSPILKSVNVRVLTNADCRSRGNDVQESEFCTGLDKGDVGSACSHDSGGPVIQQGKVFGLIDRGKACDGYAGDIHVAISPYLSWIRSNTITA